MRLHPPVSARDHVRGARDAPVELVEFGDYECPHCARAHGLLGRIEQRLGGVVRFVFRNFPLGQIHPRALPAALIAEGAGFQGHFWEMHDTLYTHHPALTDDDLLRYAADLGLDPTRLADDIPAARARIHADVDSASRSGVSGTPTFFVHGFRYEGPWWKEDDFATFLLEVANRATAPA